MLNGVKVTMQFESDKYAWSEAHWWLTSSTPDVLDAYNPARQLATYRVPCLGYGCNLARIRLSLSPANRRVFDISYAGGVSSPVWPPDPTGFTYAASRPFTAVLTQFEDGVGDTVNLYLAGAPQSLAHAQFGNNSGLVFATCPDFQSRYYALMNYLTTTGWGWPSRISTPLVQVQALVMSPGTPLQVGVQTLAAIPGAVVNSQLLVKGFRRLNPRAEGINGLWRVASIVPPAGSVTNWTYYLLNSQEATLNNYTGVGQVGLLTLSLLQYGTFAPIAVTERKRGGSLGRPRGRSRTLG